ncbi:hypothetical protein D5085_01630 [Ectothiorhodospiraceae bacterium BW-2]|nr:hypothetical protein D5085_01630 [Ectothiorhodospiraceae bacterium BW-2]
MSEASVTESVANPKQKPRRSRIDIAQLLEQYEQMTQELSEADIAQHLDIPRTTLRHWRQRKESLPCSPVVADFFEHPDGIAFLHRLIITLHFVLSYQPHGLRGVMQMIQLSGLDIFVANSLGAQQAVAQPIEQKILSYGAEQREQAVAHRSQTPVKPISLIEDETFHPDICLVAMEAVSGYILVEQYAADRSADTWNKAVDESINELTMKVIQSTSDEAKGLISHAKHYEANHSPDLFHLLHEIAKTLFRRFSQKYSECQTELDSAQTRVNSWEDRIERQQTEQRGPGRPANHQPKLEQAQAVLDKKQRAFEQIARDYQQAKDELNGISSDYHLVDLQKGTGLPPEERIDLIRQRMERLKSLVYRYGLGDKVIASIEKAERLLPAMQQTLCFVTETMNTRLKELDLNEEITDAIHDQLIPALYLQRVAQRMTTAEKAQPIAATSQALLEPLRQSEHPIMSLPEQERAQIDAVANECADLFQRSSSAVEGRNGHLALWHHPLHRLSDERLSALTIVHNYHNAAGNDTPAQRLFQRPHDSLFAYLLNQVDLPRRPAQKRVKPDSKPVLAMAA